MHPWKVVWRQDSGSWVMCCMHLFKNDPFVGLTLLEAELQECLPRLPSLPFLLPAGWFVCPGQSAGSRRLPGKLLQMCQPLSGLGGHGKVLVLSPPCPAAVLTSEKLMDTGPTCRLQVFVVWHTFSVNSHDSAFTLGHLGHSVFASKG